MSNIPTRCKVMQLWINNASNSVIYYSIGVDREPTVKDMVGPGVQLCYESIGDPMHISLKLLSTERYQRIPPGPPPFSPTLVFSDNPCAHFHESASTPNLAPNDLFKTGATKGQFYDTIVTLGLVKGDSTTPNGVNLTFTPVACGAKCTADYLCPDTSMCNTCLSGTCQAHPPLACKDICNSETTELCPASCPCQDGVCLPKNFTCGYPCPSGTEDRCPADCPCIKGKCAQCDCAGKKCGEISSNCGTPCDGPCDASGTKCSGGKCVASCYVQGTDPFDHGCKYPCCSGLHLCYDPDQNNFTCQPTCSNDVRPDCVKFPPHNPACLQNPAYCHSSLKAADKRQ